MRVYRCKPWSDAFDAAIAGYVRAERINDVVAKPDTERYQKYLRLVQEQFMGEPATDPDDEYRDRELLPRAIDAYEIRHGTELLTGRIYYHDEFPICAAPDAIEDHQRCITVHIRRRLSTYEKAVAEGVTRTMRRVSLLQMRITGMAVAKHLDYYENAASGVRKLREHVVTYDHGYAEKLLEAAVQFAVKTRFRAAEAVS